MSIVIDSQSIVKYLFMSDIGRETRQGLGTLLETDIDPQTKEVYEGIRSGALTITALQNLLDADRLTGFLNTRGFETRLESYLARRVTGVLIAIDVDDFKRFNDTKGHPAGDSLLKRSAQVLLEQTRTDSSTEDQPNRRHKRDQQKDLLGRAGGDEFLVFLVGAEAPDAINAAKRIRRAIVTAVRKQFPDYGPEQTMSLGLSAIRPEDNIATLRQRADQALYVAKQGKGSGIVEDSIAIY